MVINFIFPPRGPVSFDSKEPFLRARGWFQSALREQAKEVPAENIKNIFKKEDDFEGAWGKEVLSLLKEETLLDLAGISQNELSTLQTKDLSLRDRALDSVMQRKMRGVFNEMQSDFVYMVDNIITLLVETIGLQDIAGNELEQVYGRDSGSAKYHFETVLAMLLIPSTVFTYFVGKVKTPALAILLTTATVLGAISLMLFYVRFLKLCPKKCPGLDNMNEIAKRERQDPVFERRDLLEKIEAALVSGQGVLLVSKPGVGKSSLVKSLVERIERGRSSQSLCGKQIFSCNAGSFDKHNHEDSTSFNIIKSVFGRHEDQVIFFFDEIHAAFHGDRNPSDEIKTFVDRFHSTIVATTNDGLDKFSEDKAFMRRFVRIDVNELSESELKASLYQLLRHKNRELGCDEEAMETVLTKAKEAKGTSKVHAAHNTLREAIFKATHLTFDDLEREVQKLTVEQENADNGYLHHGANTEGPNELKAKNEELTQKKRQLETIRKIEKVYADVWSNSFKLADKTPRQWLENRALLNLLQKILEERKQLLGLPPKITKDLVESLAALPEVVDQS